ncbi:MAG: hypothetical protein R2742_06130 [Micropruina glycogenica]
MSVVVEGVPQSAVQRLRHAQDLRRQADAIELQAVADLACEHGWTTNDEFDVTGERAVRIGADGTALVGEFLPLEVAAIKAISVAAATWLIRDVLNLHDRHPMLWSSVQKGQVQPYRAFQLTQLAARYDLNVEQSHDLDQRLASKYGRIGWARLMRLARGLIAIIAADAVKAAADQARAERYVRTATTEQPVVTELWARLDTADAQQLEATIAAIAKNLAAQGDTDEPDVLFESAQEYSPPRTSSCLPAGRDDKRYLPRTTIYLHLTDTMLTSPDDHVVRGETLGPLVRDQLRDLFGTHRLTISPAHHPSKRTEPGVDSYELLDRIQESVLHARMRKIFRTVHARPDGRTDHTIPYIDGVENQTRPDNLGPLTRGVHRAKTATRLALTTTYLSGVFWWIQPHHQALPSH